MLTSEQPSDNSGIQGAIDRLTEAVDRVDELIGQLSEWLKATHKVQLSPQLPTLVREIRRNVQIISHAVAQNAAHTHQLEELVRIFALITSSLEPDQVLEEVMDTVIHLTNAERGYLMLLDEETNSFVIRTSRDRGRRSLPEEDVIFSRSIAHAAISQAEPIITINAQSDPRFQGLQSVSVNNLRSIMAIPLVLHSKVIGVLYADNPVAQGVFTQESVPVLKAFAGQAAIAIDNAKRFSRVRADLERAEQEMLELRIQIDERKREQAVREITETEYFHELEILARSLRRRARRSEKGR
ncbi:MAG: GAF domain-containing protein [Anaerolineae bacterium]|nr:GAF domain-containing protein [Anaerolineae bacterium]MDW8300570.1 GAF domain-containing protein [Anaerolineae bacterium]